MDRREALRKLGVAGAIAAGGSMVLSSNSVAYAASGTCIAQIPDSVTITIVENAQTVVLSYSPQAIVGVTTSYGWSGATLETSNASPRGVVRIAPPANTSTVTLQRAASSNGSLKNWAPGETYRVDLQITWSCVGSPSDVAVYRVSAIYGGATTVSAPKQ